ncbi:hypothetical protein ABPG72_005084 [Tetrahymena utriculariae]
MKSNIKPAIFTDEKDLQNLNKFLKLYQEISDFKLQEKKAISICFLVDVTGSMKKYVTQVKDQIQKIYDQIKYKSNQETQIFVSLIGYRDRLDEKSYESLQFTKNLNEFQKFIINLKYKGGGDSCEDVKIGFEQVLQLKWNQEHLNLLIWIADSPCHGNIFHSKDVEDNFPLDDENQIDLLLNQICELQIDVYFYKINKTTDIMIKKFNEYLSKYDNFIKEYKFKSKFFFLSVSLNFSSSSQSLPFQQFKKFTGSQQNENKFKQSQELKQRINDYQKQMFEYEKKNQQKIILVGDIDQKIIQEQEIKNLSDIEFIESKFNVYKFKLNDDPNKIDLQSEEEINMDVSKIIIGQGAYKDVYLGRDCQKGNIYVLKKFKNQNQFDFDNLITEYYIYLISLNIRSSFINSLKAKFDNKQCPDQNLYLDDQWIIQNQTTKTYYLMEAFKLGFKKYFNNDSKVIDNSPKKQNLIQSFLHYSFEQSNYSFILSDIQGFDNTINDISIHSQKFMDSFQSLNTKPQLVEQFQNKKQLNMLELKVNFPIQPNLGSLGIALFFNTHKCSSYCKKLNLKSIKEYEALIPQKKHEEKFNFNIKQKKSNSPRQPNLQYNQNHKKDILNTFNQPPLKYRQNSPSHLSTQKDIQLSKSSYNQNQIQYEPYVDYQRSTQITFKQFTPQNYQNNIKSKIENQTPLRQRLNSPILSSAQGYSQFTQCQNSKNQISDYVKIHNQAKLQYNQNQINYQPKTENIYPPKEKSYQTSLSPTQRCSQQSNQNINQNQINGYPKVDDQTLKKEKQNSQSLSPLKRQSQQIKSQYNQNQFLCEPQVDYQNPLIETFNSKQFSSTQSSIKQLILQNNQNNKISKMENQTPQTQRSPILSSAQGQSQFTQFQNSKNQISDYLKIDNQTTLLYNQNQINQQPKTENIYPPKDKSYQTSLSPSQRKSQLPKQNINQYQIYGQPEIDNQTLTKEKQNSQYFSPKQRQSKQEKLQNSQNQIQYEPQVDFQNPLNETLNSKQFLNKKQLIPQNNQNNIKSKMENQNPLTQRLNSPIYSSAQRQSQFTQFKNSKNQKSDYPKIDNQTFLQNNQNQINKKPNTEDTIPLKQKSYQTSLSPTQRYSQQAKQNINQNQINGYPKVDYQTLSKEKQNSQSLIPQQRQKEQQKLQKNQNWILYETQVDDKNPLIETLNSKQFLSTQSFKKQLIQQNNKSNKISKMENQTPLRQRLNSPILSSVQGNGQFTQFQNSNNQISDYHKIDNQTQLQNNQNLINFQPKIDKNIPPKEKLHQPSLSSTQRQSQLTKQYTNQNQINGYPEINYQTLKKEKQNSQSLSPIQRQSKQQKSQYNQNQKECDPQVDYQNPLIETLNFKLFSSTQSSIKQLIPQNNQNNVKSKMENQNPLGQRLNSPILSSSQELSQFTQFENNKNQISNYQKFDNQTILQYNQNYMNSQPKIEDYIPPKEKLYQPSLSSTQRYSQLTKQCINQNQINGYPEIKYQTLTKKKQNSQYLSLMQRQDKCQKPQYNLNQKQYESQINYQTPLKMRQNSPQFVSTQNDNKQSLLQYNQNNINDKQKIDILTPLKEEQNSRSLLSTQRYCNQYKQQFNQNQIINNKIHLKEQPTLSPNQRYNQFQKQQSFSPYQRNIQLSKVQNYNNQISDKPKIQYSNYNQNNINNQPKIDNLTPIKSLLPTQQYINQYKQQSNQNQIVDNQINFKEKLNQSSLSPKQRYNQFYKQQSFSPLQKNIQLSKVQINNNQISDKPKIQDQNSLKDYPKIYNLIPLKEKLNSPQFQTTQNECFEYKYYENLKRQTQNTGDLYTQKSNQDIPKACNLNPLKQQLKQDIKLEIGVNKYEKMTIPSGRQSNRDTFINAKRELSKKCNNEQMLNLSSNSANEKKQKASLTEKLLECIKKFFKCWY